MKCQKCNKKEATTHYTQIINGKKTEYYLCEDCAGVNEEIAEFEHGFDDEFNNFFSGFFGNHFLGQPETLSLGDDTCKVCGTGFNEFANSGRLGCSHCYDTFASRLLNPLKQIHGRVKHTGKVPSRMGGELKKQREIEKLEAELKDAVGTQNFEQAAKLRDKIKELRENA